MIAINNPEINVDEIMKKIREEVAKRKHREKRPFESSKTHIPETWSTYEQTKIPNLNLHELSIHPPFKKSDNGAYHVNDLLKYHHKEFVKNAYLAILGRNPDSSGLDNYLRLLNRGEASKMEILGRLRYSSEGRKINVRIRGLTVPFVGHLLFRIPVLGYLARLGTAVLKMPRVLRNIRQFENYTVSMHEAFLNHINQNSSDIERNFNQLAETLKNEMQRYEELHNSLASINQGLAERDERIEGLDASVIKKGIEHAKQIDALEASINQGLAKQAERISGFEKSISENLSERDKQIVALETSVYQKVHDQNSLIAGLEVTVNQGLAERDERIEGLDESVIKKDVEHSKQIDALEASINQGLADQEERIAKLDRTNSYLKEGLTLQEGRLSVFLEEARKHLPEPISNEQIETMIAEEDHLLDAMYAAFEDRFRGAREDIKERIKVYLPYVENVLSTTQNGSILDLGCGRGEWIELLKENGYKAKGIDRNRVMVSQSEDLGLDVFEADVIEYLKGVPANSLAAVTGFHIIEHLPFNTLITLFDESLRVLKPGGIVIFETPNPENIIVGSCNFYIDPTHRNPIPPMTLKFIAEARGFNEAEIIRTSPLEFMINNHENSFNKIVERFNAEQDYAVVGYKI